MLDSHPYWFVRETVQNNLDGLSRINFSYYKYSPQSVEDDRIEFDLDVGDFLNPACMERVIRECPEGRELAFHSRLIIDSKEFHLPLVDMSTGSTAALPKLKLVLGTELFARFRWYRSGRSFHGYGGTLVSQTEWVKLMGLFLLANKQGLPPTVDPRWVGHRLLGGYSALRWTKNTMHYRAFPEALLQ